MDGYALRGAPPITAAEILGPVTEIFTGIGQARPVRKGEREAGLWDYTVPKSRRLVDLIRAYAEQGAKLHIEANDIELGSVELATKILAASESGVTIDLKYSLLGGDDTAKQVLLPYPNPTAAMLFSGRWIDFGVACVKLGQILPSVSWEADTAVLRWSSDPPGIQLGQRGFFGLLRRVTTTRLSEIRIGPEYGDFVAHGLVGWGLPRLKWA